jgi:hypothetical protein
MNPHVPESDDDVPAIDVVPVTEMRGADDEDTALLRAMSREAEEYLRTFSWCDDVRSSYFGGGVAGVFAVFLFHIRSARPEVCHWIWIVVGDIPFAYLPVEDASTAKEVFNAYVRGMRNWVELARLGRSETAGDDVPPIDVASTPEWAEKLQHRLNSLMLMVQPLFDGDSESDYAN